MKASPGVVEGPDFVGVERDGLASLVPVVGAVGRHTARRREGEEHEESCRGPRGRRHRSQSGGVDEAVAGRGFGGGEIGERDVRASGAFACSLIERRRRGRETWVWVWVWLAPLVLGWRCQEGPGGWW
jgi:hypothetical protein